MAQVCRRLEGIPLAIELAAARMGVLSVEQIAERLDDSLRLLTAGGRTAAPPSDAEGDAGLEPRAARRARAEAVRRLSVFAGGWTLEAAEAVGAGDGIEQDDVLDLLSRLVDKSLVVAEARRGGRALRYRMLEPLGSTARSAWRRAGRRSRSGSATRILPGACGRGRCARGRARIERSRPVAWLKRMESEHANLRAASHWSLDKDDEPDGGRAAQLGLRLAVALWWFWHTHDYLSEGRRYLERALSK